VIVPDESGNYKSGRMIAGMLDWLEASGIVYAVGGAFGGLGKAGLITIIVVALIAIVAFVWIFRETRRRD
jgi:hypothetical protein